MLEIYRQAIADQFGASLIMLADAMRQCPDELWTETVGRFPFWHIAYHTLFYTDLYLSLSEDAFIVPPFHHAGYQCFGRTPWPPHEVVVADQPYDRTTLLAYADQIAAKLAPMLRNETPTKLAEPCGFPWLKLSRAELYTYNLRHVQHHVGQLSALLVRHTGRGVTWCASRRES
ncbi:MAG: DinB family protein [Phycisphaeraceae bacterium]|nr:DinB family protein [Phycisphaeraceae bacterium]